MAGQSVPLLSFNRGLISKLALARTDLKRTGLSAEEQTNWMPRALGSMMLRAGWGYVDTTLNNSRAIHVPFVFAVDDTAIIELTDSSMRVRVGEAIIARQSVATAVSNGTFNSNLSGWSDDDEPGATSQWVAGGYMGLAGTGYNAAVRSQQVAVGAGDLNREHGIRVVVARGPVTLRIGSSAGGDQYLAEATLRTGTYSFAVTPTTDLYIRVSSLTPYQVLLDSIAVEAAGDMTIGTPWTEALLPYVRYKHGQSGDVIFAECSGVQQRRVERYSARSWGLAIYAPEDGPFRLANTGTTRLTPTSITGDIGLGSSAPLFRPAHVGALFRITSIGQLVQSNLSGADQYSNPVRVIGVGASQRTFNILIVGGWAGTLTLQRSVGAVGSWVDVNNYTGNTTTTYNDGLDNQIIYYRIGFKTGAYTSGTAAVSLSYANGGLTGIVRVTGYTSSTSVSASVLTPLGGTDASSDWSEGEWSDHRGWPSAGGFFEGRLWQTGKDKIAGSISDAFESFDDETTGDSGPINRSIGSGPVDRINWLLPLLRLVVGTQGAERSARSSSLDEPLTPTNFNLKAPSTRGSSPVEAEVIDANGIFVRGTRLFQLSYQGDSTVDYTSTDLTIIAPEVGTSGFARIAVQRYPDTRIHAVRNDGAVAVMVYDPAEDVRCWILVETDGVVEDAFVLPAPDTDEEDKVYYVVRRTINGATRRFLERWAPESECQGGPLNKQADSFVSYTGAATATVAAPHLAGEEVVVWGDGADLGTFILDGSGHATLPAAVSNYVVGLPYAATYKSTKLAYAAGGGTALTKRKRVDHIGLILSNTHYQGLQFGPDFDNLDDLPLVEEGADTPAATVWESYDEDRIEFPGEHDTDSRICLRAAAPRHCTVLAAVVDMQTGG